MTHRKVGDYRLNDEEIFPSSSVQCVHHNSMLHVQSSRDTDISIVIWGGGGILTHWLKNEHYLRDIYKWHRQLSAPRKLIFVTKRVKTFHAFSLTLHARPINVEFDCIPKVAILFVQRHVRAALRSSRPHLCRPRFGRTHGPVVRQVRNEWMNVLMNEWRKEGMCSHH